MKQRTPAKARKMRPAATRVPSHEECLTFVMKNLKESHHGRSPKIRQQESRFKRVARTASKLDFDRYPEMARLVMAPGLAALAAESSKVLLDELHEFLKRYEALHWQVISGKATHQQVIWALSHRFFLPWLALRISYRARKNLEAVGDCWFIPIREGSLYPSAMKLVDQFVRQGNEPNAQLALRLQRSKPPDPAIPKISLNAMRETDAEHLRENFSKYCHFKSSPPLETIELIAANAKAAPHLRHMLVLARFIDRCVGDALPVFGEPQVLKLVEFFALCLAHCGEVIKQVRAEVPASRFDRILCAGRRMPKRRVNESERVWRWLASPTFMGNTAGQHERFYPLMDEHMNELPRIISAELRRTVRKGELSGLPRNEVELNSGPWRMPAHIRIPREIEGVPVRATVRAAVNRSRKAFRGHNFNIAAAERARWKFEFLGLGTFVVKAEGRGGFCSDEDASLAEAECKRLYLLIYSRLPEPDRARMAVQFLKYLVEPYRPKAPGDRILARGLFKVASKLQRQGGFDGAVHYQLGCLHALDGDHDAALRCFVAARSFGWEACGSFWIDLLRAGLAAAVRVKSSRERKNFAKLARLFGLFSKDTTPRTNLMQEQMLEENFVRADHAAFKPFPSGESASRRRSSRRWTQKRPRSADERPSHLH